MFRRLALIGALSCVVVPAAAPAPARAAAPPELRTVAEQSNYLRTGRYDEVERHTSAGPRELMGRHTASAALQRCS